MIRTVQHEATTHYDVAKWLRKLYTSISVLAADQIASFEGVALSSTTEVATALVNAGAIQDWKLWQLNIRDCWSLLDVSIVRQVLLYKRVVHEAVHRQLLRMCAASTPQGF